LNLFYISIDTSFIPVYQAKTPQITPSIPAMHYYLPVRSMAKSWVT